MCFELKHSGRGCVQDESILTVDGPMLAQLKVRHGGRMLQTLVFTGLDHQLITVPVSSIESLETDQRRRAVLLMTGGEKIVVKEPVDIVRKALRCLRTQ